jgi:hypothetical protein
LNLAGASPSYPDGLARNDHRTDADGNEAREGSESYAPLARALIGGLFAAVLLTVFLVPAGFFLAYRNRQNLWCADLTPNQFQENRNYPLIGWRPVEKGLGKTAANWPGHAAI